eukprot:355305-Chlamydomonas_euryale.AAC.3
MIITWSAAHPVPEVGLAKQHHRICSCVHLTEVGPRRGRAKRGRRAYKLGLLFTLGLPQALTLGLPQASTRGLSPSIHTWPSPSIPVHVWQSGRQARADAAAVEHGSARPST